MSSEQNKKIAIGLLEDFSKGNMDGVLNAMADNAIWWVAGDLPNLSGTNTKQQMALLFNNLGSLFPKGLAITTDSAIAEGDRVAIEAHSYGEAGTGKIYQNKYHWLFEVRGGKIEVVKEYMDTKHANEAILGG